MFGIFYIYTTLNQNLQSQVDINALVLICYRLCSNSSYLYVYSLRRHSYNIHGRSLQCHEHEHES